MKQRLVTLLAAAALLVVGAAPALAAPGGVPGPPEGHGRTGSDDAVVADEGEVESKLPAHAKAYGKRLKDHYGIPYGHLQQCAGIADDGDVSEGDEAVDGDEAADGDEPRKALEACPEEGELVFPEDGQGAKALWILTEAGLLVAGV